MSWRNTSRNITISFLFMSVILSACVLLYPIKSYASVEQDNAAPVAVTSSPTPAVSSPMSDESAPGSSVPSAQVDEASTAPQDAKEDTSAHAPGLNSNPLADGEYVIVSALDPSKAVDVVGGSKADGANVQICTSNMTGAQRWNAEYNSSTGLYTLTNVASGKVLDVAGGQAFNGTNVQQFTGNGTKAQQWVIKKENDGYVILSGIDSGLALDLAGANTANGSNLQVFQSNGTLAQRFRFLSLLPSVPVSAEIEDGVYAIASAVNEGKVFDVAGNTRNAGGNIQVYSDNGSSAQSFAVVRASNGYYCIYNVGTGKALDVCGGNLVPGTNVRQWDPNGTTGQCWSIQLNADQTVSFVSLANGLALDICGGSTANGTNVQCYTPNGTLAQRFLLVPRKLVVAGQFYEVALAENSEYVLDVSGADISDSARFQIYSANGTLAQRYEFSTQADDSYSIRVASSGKYLCNDGNALVQKDATVATPAAWNLVWSNRGILLTDAVSGKALELHDGFVSSGNLVQVGENNGTISQRFLLHSVQLISNGMYILHSGTGSVLDIAGGSTRNGANAQIYGDNGTNAQKFNLVCLGGNIYSIQGAQSGKYLDVYGGSHSDGANVQLWDGNGSDAQLWRASVSKNGFLLFTNVGSGMALAVAGGSSAWGTNVQQHVLDGTPAQDWKPVATTYYVDPYTAEERTFISRAQGFSSSTGWLVLVDRSRCRVAVFQGARGNWALRDLFSCVVGAPSTPTILGTYTTKGRRMELSTDSRARYCTQIQGGYFFHTILSSNSELGHWASHGCVRLPVEKAKWIYYNLPLSSTVNIF